MLVLQIHFLLCSVTIGPPTKYLGRSTSFCSTTKQKIFLILEFPRVYSSGVGIPQDLFAGELLHSPPGCRRDNRCLEHRTGDFAE